MTAVIDRGQPPHGVGYTPYDAQPGQALRNASHVQTERALS
jgi:hypothetical protein